MQAILTFLDRHRFVLLLSAALYGLDRATKFVVTYTMELGESVPAEGFFRITYIYNTGSAFGLFRGQNTPLIVVSFVGIAVLTWFYRTQARPGSLLRASLGLQIAGAMGNLTDRLTVGQVVDFIDVGPWPIFNVADSSIVTGVLLLGWAILTSKAEPSPTVAQSRGTLPPGDAPVDDGREHRS